MTDERDKSSRGSESVARPTARDVPFVRGVASDEEAPPRARRPEQLPRDPSYEAELAQVELAVMRDPQRRADPSTKPGGRAHYAPPASSTEPPPSVTPESPATHRAREPVSRSPEPPASSGGRAVASGTLLSVGSVDPRGKTERTLETPRMFFSQQGASTEAYFKPGKIPAVTVHQTLETETVKLSDSIDPRRAKTLPRIDRAMLERLARVAPSSESEQGAQESEDFDQPASAASAPIAWNRADYEPATPLDERLQGDRAEDDRLQDGQIHASLSPFREHAAPSYEFDGSPTRPEPFVVRRTSDAPETFVPDPSTVPTQRDLPQHRIEASRPPPAPVVAKAPAEVSDSAAPLSEIAGPTTASIITEGPAQPRPWLRLVAFAVALLSAVALGWWLTSSGSSDERAKVPEKQAPSPAKTTAAPTAAPPVADGTPPASPDTAVVTKPAPKTPPVVPTANAPQSSPPRAASDVNSGNSTPAPAAPTPTAARKPTPAKPARETIF